MSYRTRKGIWDILEGETETEKCYNYYLKKFQKIIEKNIFQLL